MESQCQFWDSTFSQDNETWLHVRFRWLFQRIPRITTVLVMIFEPILWYLFMLFYKLYRVPIEAYEQTRRYSGDCHYRNCLKGTPQFLLFCLCGIALYIGFVLYYIAMAPYYVARLLLFFGLLLCRNCRSRKRKALVELIEAGNQVNDTPYDFEARYNQNDWDDNFQRSDNVFYRSQTVEDRYR